MPFFFVGKYLLTFNGVGWYNKLCMTDFGERDIKMNIVLPVLGVLSVCYIIFIVFIVLKLVYGRYNKKSDNKDKGITIPITKYEDAGYDKNDFNIEGYNINGINAKGKYNRLYDKQSYINSDYNREGFLNPRIYPVVVGKHARERIYERHISASNIDADKLVRDAYSYGKSAYQIKKTSAAELKEIEERHENGIALIYHGYIYIFSQDNKLITMYRNDKIII